MDHSEIGRAIGAECLCFRARRVSRVLTRHFDEALRPLGIQATQLTLLGSIAGPGPGGQTMPRLTDMLAMDATTLSRNLRPLEKAGLVAITRSDKDKRVRIARLTRDGERVLEAALPVWRDAQDRLVQALGPEAALDLRTQFDATAALSLPTGGSGAGSARSHRNNAA
jgi:DNA-binding MarR family transcriptional regulator